MYRSCTRARAATLVMALACVGTQVFAQSPVTVIRVNAGGSAYTDTVGNSWSADAGYSGGVVFNNNSTIAGTNDPTLYRIGRYDNSTAAPTLQYSFTLPDGWYEIRLHFAEPSLSPGVRRFNVALEGTTILSNLDVSAEAGVDSALVKSVTTQITDGQLNLDFLHGAADNPFINAIEILSSSAPTTPLNVSATAHSATQLNLSWAPSTDDTSVVGYRVERCSGAACTTFTQVAAPSANIYHDGGLAPSTTYRYRVSALDDAGNASSFSAVVTATTTVSGSFSTLRVNAGGGSYVDADGNSWSADSGYNSGTVFNNNSTIAGTSDPTLYRIGRYDNSSAAPTLQYSFNVPNGGYDVRLHFAEPSLAPAARQFNVQIEGITSLANLDVSAEAGVDTALVKLVATQVFDGQLNIHFLHGAVENPFINAVEVVQTATFDRQAPSVPIGFAASPVSSSRIDLSWGTATDNVGVTGYRLERCQSAGCTGFAEISAPVGSPFSDTTVTGSGTYRYRLRAADAAGNLSGYSTTITVFTPGSQDSQAPTAPSALNATAVSGTQINLAWTASTDNVEVSGYRLERCEGAGCTGFIERGTVKGPSFNDTGLNGSTSYSYRVRAYDAAGNLGGYSPVDAAVTLAGSGVAGSAAYEYDSFGRLKQVTVSPN